MKKIFLALAAVSSLAGASAFAETGYIGGAVGQSHFNADCSGTTDCKTNDTGYKLFGGYKFSPNLAGEVNYFDFGKATASANLGGTPVSVQLKGTGFGIGIAAMGDFAPQWSGVARVGVASIRAKATATAGSLTGTDSETKTTAYAGFGVSYAVTKELKVDGAIDFSNAKYAGETFNVRLLSVGLTYAF
ncbi:MAG: outer membrane beta-barrel protein [Rhizobacter sp.]